MIPNLKTLWTCGIARQVAIAALALLCHSSLFAAGLGAMKVLSQLGQPFAADIELINVSRDELSTLKVNLAPPAAYQSANLTFDPALKTLRLSVEQSANGSAYIRATSFSRVTEPYLYLLVELYSRDSKVQRIYSALLDLPSSVEPAVASASPAPAGAAVAPVPQASSAAPRAPAVRPASKALPAQTVAPAAVPAPAAVIPAVRPQLALPEPARAVVVKPEAPSAPAEISPPKSDAAKPIVVETAPASSSPSKTELTKPEAMASASVPAATPDAPATAAAKAAVPAAPPAVAADTQTSYMLPVIGLALVLLGGLWALRRRKPASAETGAPTAPRMDTPTASTPEHDVGAAPAVAAAAVKVAASAKVATPDVTVASASDVDPVEEAEVYRKYGRDEAAEKVLRDALSKQPGRVDVQMSLLEILSARGDADGFNQVAGRLHKQTGGLGEHWKRAMALGFALDPNYPLYSPPDHAPAYAPQSVEPAGAASGDMSNTMDINLLRDDAGADMEKTLVLPRVGAAPAAPKAVSQPLPEFRFELPGAGAVTAQDATEDAAATPVAKEDAGLDFNISDFASKPQAEETLAPPLPALVSETVSLEADALEAAQQKLDLASAYREMGDKEAALELLHEVEREGDAGQQAEARGIIQSMA